MDGSPLCFAPNSDTFETSRLMVVLAACKQFRSHNFAGDCGDQVLSYYIATEVRRVYDGLLPSFILGFDTFAVQSPDPNWMLQHVFQSDVVHGLCWASYDF